MVTNVSDKPIEVTGVVLDENAVNLQLVASQVTDDLSASSAGFPYSGDTSGGFTAVTVAPGQMVLIDVGLAPIGPSYGWTNGMWVLLKTSSGQRLRIHSCYAVIVVPPGTGCIDDSYASDPGYPTEGPKALCGVTEVVRG